MILLGWKKTLNFSFPEFYYLKILRGGGGRQSGGASGKKSDLPACTSLEWTAVQSLSFLHDPPSPRSNFFFFFTFLYFI